MKLPEEEETETDSILSSSVISQIKSYYKFCPIDLTVVPQVNFRHFRFRLVDGSFYKVDRKIRDLKDLREHLVMEAPTDVYYSTACWLNPHLLGSRTEKDILKNVMISCDLAFDIDVSREIRTLDDARLQALALFDFLESKGINIRYSAFSGSKGFHVVCDDPWNAEITEENPMKRELEAVERRKKVVKEAKEENLLFDEKVTVDTRRIIRLPGTINSKSGLLCAVLDKKELRSGMEKILKSERQHSIITPRIPKRREMTHDFIVAKFLRRLGRMGVRPTPERGPCYCTFVTSNVPGTVLKIPVLEFGGWKKIEEVIDVVKKVQSHYALGDFFVFSDGSRFNAFSLKAVSRRRLEKILFAAGSMNLNACRKYGCTYTRVGKSIGLNGKVARKEPELVKVLESDLKGQVSKAHYEFFTSLGVKIRARGEKLNLSGAGKEKLELVHAIIE
jgi:DNA primase catalytic subunit